MVDRNVNVTADVWIANGDHAYGNGKGDYLHLGKSVMSDGFTVLNQRILLEFDLTALLADLVSLSAGTLTGKTVPSGTACDTQGGNPKFFVERITDDFAENSQSSNCGLSSSSASNTRWGVDAHPITTNRGSYAGSPGGNTLVNVTILALLQDALALFDPDDEDTHTLRLRLIASDGAAYDEGASGRRIAFWSKDSSSTPFSISITGSDNHPSDAPINLTPTGGALVNEGDGFTIAGDQSDLDVGDYMTRVDWEVAADSAGSPGSTILTGNFVPTGTLPTHFSKFISGAGISADLNPLLWYRVRTWDKAGTGAGVPTPAWSAYQQVQINTTPGLPTSLAIDTDSLTPHVRSTLNDADSGAVLGAVKTQVEEDTALGIVSKYDSGWVTYGAGTRSDETVPGGAALNWNTPYRFRQWHKDNVGKEGPTPGWTTVTLTQSLGPTAMSPKDINTALMSQLPTFTIGHVAAFDQYEAEWASGSDGSGTLLDIGVTANGTPGVGSTSLGVVYSGAPLGWGRIGYWRAKVRNAATGNWTDWSPWWPYYVNDLPKAPTITENASNYQWSTDATGKHVVASLFPEWDLAFNDDDSVAPYSQVPTRREEEYRRITSDTLVAKIVRSIDITSPVRAGVLLYCNTATGWTAGTAAVLSADSAGGFSFDGTALKAAITALGAGSTSLELGPRFDLNGEYTDLSSALVTVFKVQCRASSLTNLSTVRVRFHTGGNDANFYEFNCKPSVINVLEVKTLTKAAPDATGGAPNWAQVHRISFAIVAVTGAYTGNVWFDYLQIDPIAVLNTDYRMRVRHFDGNTDNVWGPWTDYRLYKTSAAPTVGAGTAPDVTDPTPTIAHTFAGSGGKTQSKQVVRAYSGTGGSKVLIGTYEQIGVALGYVLPESLLTQATSFTAEVDGYDTDNLFSTVTITWGPTAFLVPHRLYAGVTAGGASTTLAALAALSATNLRLTSIAQVAVGNLLRVGAGNTTIVVEVSGPVDVNGVFNGTAGAGGTGADLTAPIDIAQINGAAVLEVDPALIATGASDSRVNVAWAASQLTAAHYSAVQIERENIDGSWTVAGRVTDPAVLSYTDRDAPVGRTARYRVKQTNGWAYSAAAYGETLQVPDSETGGWFYIGAVTFDIHLVTGWTRRPRVIDEVIDGQGRAFPIVNKFNTDALGYEGTISITVPAAYDYQRLAFEAACRSSSAVTIKNGKGEVYRLVLGQVDSSPDAVWTEAVTFGWTQVE